MDIRKEVELRKDLMVKDLQEWIKTGGVLDKSTAKEGQPFGEAVKNTLNWIYNKAKEDGFDVVNHDGYCVEITYGKQEETVMVLGHADVVPVGEGWSYPPFGGEIHDNLIYGRGASDDKGPTLAAYYGLKIIKDLQIPLKRQIKIVVGGNEESGSLCMHHYFHTLGKKAPTYGFTPDADFPLIYGEKGIMTYVYEGDFSDNVIESFDAGVAANSVPSECVMVLKGDYNFKEDYDKWMEKHNFKADYEVKEGKTYLKFYGKAAHGAFPEGGINAFTMLLRVVSLFTDSEFAKHFGYKLSCYYGKRIGINHYSEPMGHLTMNVGVAKYDGKHYGIVINIRYPNDMKYEEIVQNLDKSIMHKGFCPGNSSPLYVDPNSEFIQTLLKVYQDVTGDYESKPMTIGGGTYARETQNTVAFGMEFKNNRGSGSIHSPNERLHIDDLVDGAHIYTEALIKLGNL